MRRVLALLSVATVWAAPGCATPGGVHVEGRVSQVSAPAPRPSPQPGQPASADPVAVVRADPAVTAEVKGRLVLCGNGAYPVDDRYVELTGDTTAELVVTLFQCPDAEKVVAGYAAFVYSLTTEPPTQLFAVTDGFVDVAVSPSWAGELLVISGRWAPRDDPCCPSDQVVVPYRWNGSTFVEVPR